MISLADWLSLARNPWALGALGVFFILIAGLDLKYRLIPNILVFPAMVVVMFASLFAPFVDLRSMVLGGIFGLLLFALVAYLRPGTLGGGDVKLAALIGLLFGFPSSIWALLIGILAGGMVALGLVLTRRGTGATQMPYAPFLCLGVLVALIYNPFWYWMSVGQR